jgi:16S rRNA (cytosine967-C5)-methyltransferase
MRLHAVLVNAVALALSEVFCEERYADRVIEKLLKSNPKFGSRDRGFIAETTYECVRYFRLLQHLRQPNVAQQSEDWRQFQPADFREIVGIQCLISGWELPDWIAFEHLDTKQILHRFQHEVFPPEIKYAIPDWLHQQAIAELGSETWLAELPALNAMANISLRANTLKISKSELKAQMAAQGFESRETPLCDTALVLEKRGNVFKSPSFKAGNFEVQDIGSQTIAPFLDVQSGMRVVDACAGAGGKALHLATLMQNKGTVIALDTEGWKLEELRNRARRNSIHIIETRTIDSTKVIKRLHDSADRLLLDVPCSGLGVLRRNPDAKWKLKPDFLVRIRALQAEILQNYSLILRNGGKMVYATCSILPSENEQQVAQFLEKNKGFTLLAEQKIRPSVQGCDGFYMALLQKNA